MSCSFQPSAPVSKCDWLPESRFTSREQRPQMRRVAVSTIGDVHECLRPSESESHGNLKPRRGVSTWKVAILCPAASTEIESPPRDNSLKRAFASSCRVGHRQWNLWMGYDNHNPKVSFPSAPLPSHRSRSWTLPCSAVHLLNRCHHRNLWLSATNGCMEYGIMEYVLQRKGMIYDDIWSLFNDINGWSMEECKIYRRLYPEIFAPPFPSKVCQSFEQCLQRRWPSSAPISLSFPAIRLALWDHRSWAIWSDEFVASQPSHTKPIHVQKKKGTLRYTDFCVKKKDISAIWALQIHDLQGFFVSVAFGFQLPCGSLQQAS